MWTVAFWRGAGERIVKTFIQTLLATLLADVAGKTSFWDVPWSTSLVAAVGVSLMASFFSLCTSIGNADFTAGTVAVPSSSDPTVPATSNDPTVSASSSDPTVSSATPSSATPTFSA